jgi:hypothetical protein
MLHVAFAACPAPSEERHYFHRLSSRARSVHVYREPLHEKPCVWCRYVAHLNKERKDPTMEGRNIYHVGQCCPPNWFSFVSKAEEADLVLKLEFSKAFDSINW